MTRLIGQVYERYTLLVNQIDINDDKLKAWQVSALHDLAARAERVLSGERRKP